MSHIYILMADVPNNVMNVYFTIIYTFILYYNCNVIITIKTISDEA